MKKLLFPFFLIFSFFSFGQKDSIKNKLSVEADFRFRAEEDWDSRRSDGSYRDNRSRLRYRARVGAKYQLDSRYSFELRLRTGDPRKQQDPQLTLGKGAEEFGTLQVGFEKAYFQYQEKGWKLWLGKNTFPFEKNNELFWSDNVFPEGVFAEKKFKFKTGNKNFLSIKAGHFIVEANGTSFGKDSYVDGGQILFSMKESKILLFPSFYLFKNVSDIPDDLGTYELDYSIAHLGSRIQLSEKPIFFEADIYQNLQDYSKNDSVSNSLVNETLGITSSLSYGKLKEKKDWFFKLTYAYLERYSAVDFMTQNDWSRWDYSAVGSPDGRLTNMQGIEFVACYMLEKNIKLTTKFYQVEQLVAYGLEKETNSRIRFDVDINF